MADLPAFASQRTCPKCGEKTPTAGFAVYGALRTLYKPSWTNVLMTPPEVTPERMRRTCDCGYEWYERPKEA